jgi:hypothetical protein
MRMAQHKVRWSQVLSWWSLFCKVGGCFGVVNLVLVVIFALFLIGCGNNTDNTVAFYEEEIRGLPLEGEQ